MNFGYLHDVKVCHFSSDKVRLIGYLDRPFIIGAYDSHSHYLVFQAPSRQRQTHRKVGTQSHGSVTNN